MFYLIFSTFLSKFQLGKYISGKPIAMGSDVTENKSDGDSRKNSFLQTKFNLLSLYAKENAAKAKERQLKLSNFQIEPKKSQTPLKISNDDDPDWDPFQYEEELMWNSPDPNSLQQLNQYYQSYEYYKSQYPYEDGQFDDAKSDI